MQDGNAFQKEFKISFEHDANNVAQYNGRMVSVLVYNG